MRRIPARIAWAGLMIAVLLAALRAGSEVRGRGLMERYRMLDKEVSAAQGRKVGALATRVALLRSAARSGSVAADAEIALAVEGIRGANASLLEEAESGKASGKPRAHLEEALAHVRRALLENPTNTRAWLAGYRVAESARLLGVGTGGSGPLTEDLASRFTRGALRSNPKGGDLQRSLAATMVAAGNVEGSLPHFRRALEDPGLDTEAIASEMLDAGIPPLRVLEAVPDRFAERFAAGEALRKAGQHAVAERAYLSAAGLSPRAHEPWRALSQLAREDGRNREALAYATKAFPFLRYLPPAARSEIHLCAAQAARALGDGSSSLAYALSAVEENPGHAFLYNLIATLLEERGDTPAAIRYWTVLLDQHSEDPYVLSHAGNFHRSLGRAYLRMGNDQLATRHFLDALDADPSDQEARLALARLARGR